MATRGAATESWGFKSLQELLRDLGPREDTRKVYRQFKELVEKAKNTSVGEHPNVWRPPGLRRSGIRELAADGLAATVKLRESRVLYLPSTKQEECHRRWAT